MGPRPLGRGWFDQPGTFQRVRMASMGPRPLGRGWLGGRWSCRPTPRASMGPRPLGRGWVHDADQSSVGGLVLQWGLGYGRGWIALRRSSLSHTASMGPRPLGRGWNQVRSQMQVTSDGESASMGPRPLGRGWLLFRPWESGGSRAAMGPRPLGRGWQRGCVRCRCFNGAATARSRMAVRYPATTTPAAVQRGLQWGRDR